MAIQVTTEPIDLNAIQQGLYQGNTAVGALVSFVGLVRDVNDDAAVTGLYLQHYPGMTETALQQILEQAEQRWSLMSMQITHRVGAMQPNDIIVVVAVTSAHRGEAFAACEFVMDYLKTRAPFWKKETRTDGDRWLDSRDSDQQRAQRWS